ncbi:MAG: hypothetical protein ACI9NC_006298, partial [Verrucomicrobiales bacterium]
SRSREIQPAGTRENAVNYVPFGSGRLGTSIRRTLLGPYFSPEGQQEPARSQAELEKFEHADMEFYQTNIGNRWRDPSRGILGFK